MVEGRSADDSCFDPVCVAAAEGSPHLPIEEVASANARSNETVEHERPLLCLRELSQPEVVGIGRHPSVRASARLSNEVRLIICRMLVLLANCGRQLQQRPCANGQCASDHVNKARLS